MAKKKSSGQRVVSTPTLTDPLLSESLQEVEDFRTFQPEAPFVEPRLLSGVPAVVGIKKQFKVPEAQTLRLMENPNATVRVRGPVHRSRRSSTVSRFHESHLAFEPSKSVAVCVRRHQRKEVLFALRRTGRGARARRRRNAISNIRC